MRVVISDTWPPMRSPRISRQGIKNLKKGEISDLVRGPGGFYILKVIDFDNKKLNKSDPAAREKVRKLLFEREVNRKFEEWVHDLESKAFIQISL